MTGTNGNGNGNGSAKVGTSTVKQGLAQMLKGGVIVSAFGRSPRSKISSPAKIVVVCRGRVVHRNNGVIGLGCNLMYFLENLIMICFFWL